MRKGELGPVMYLVIGVLLLVALIFVVRGLAGKSFGIVEFIRGRF